MSAHFLTVSLPLLLLLLLGNFINSSEESTNIIDPANGSGTSKEMVPLMEPMKIVEMALMLNESSRRKLRGGFQICALCTCCGGARGMCLPSPCCYAINCNIPHRPYGYCSFTPKTCNCFGCHG